LSTLITAAHGAASGLTDRERELLLGDAIDAVACRHDLDWKAAALLLDEAADRGHAHLIGDAERVAVVVDGQVVVELTRAELRELAG
jgi:hypothetical protein